MSKARELAELGAVYDSGALSNRNLLINSEFRVNQRGNTTASGVSGVSEFVSDRWQTYTSGFTYSASVQDVTLPDGTATKSFKTTATSSTASSAFFHPYQKIEALGKDYLQGKKVVLSSWVRTNVAGQYIRICDSVSCYTIGDAIPADGEWHKISAVHTMPTSMNTGVSDDIQFQPVFGFVTGINTGDYCEFALPQMELGDTATPFEHRSYGDELARCQRYFVKYTSATVNTGIANGLSQTSSTGTFTLQFNPELRSSPSIAISGLGMTDHTNYTSVVTSCHYSTASNNSLRFGLTGSAVMTTYRPASAIVQTANGYITFDAEL